MVGSWRTHRLQGSPKYVYFAGIKPHLYPHGGYVLVQIRFTSVCKGDYLNYLVLLIWICRWRGIYDFLGCHNYFLRQLTGGSGAPAWTLSKVGFDHDGMYRSRAAYCNGRLTPQSLKMVTIINGNTIPPTFAKTIWTVFFEGDKLASLVMVYGIPEGR